MAYIVPADLTRLALSGAREPEIETLRVLKQKLSPDYTIFHGVHWTREFKSETKFGEIDFVVLNQSGAILVIEQKNGSVEVTKDGLVKRYEAGSKNVGQQLGKSIDAIRDKFKRLYGTKAHPEIDWSCPIVGGNSFSA